MTTDTIYIPLHGSDIEVGKPLPWAVYDRDRQLILRQGFILETQAQLDAVLGPVQGRSPVKRKPACQARWTRFRRQRCNGRGWRADRVAQVSRRYQGDRVRRLG